jgi:hypothetical protein
MSAPFLFVTFSPLAKDDDLVDANARPPSPLTGRPGGDRQDESHKACHDDTAVPGAPFRGSRNSVSTRCVAVAVVVGV